MFAIRACVKSIRQQGKQRASPWNFRLAHFSLERITRTTALTAAATLSGTDESVTAFMSVDNRTHDFS